VPGSSPPWEGPSWTWVSPICADRNGERREHGDAAMMSDGTEATPTTTSGSILCTLVSGQFLMTLDSLVMNVSIATVARDVGTTVAGIQTAITLYTLVMASLMITGAIWARHTPACRRRHPKAVAEGVTPSHRPVGFHRAVGRHRHHDGPPPGGYGTRDRYLAHAPGRTGHWCTGVPTRKRDGFVSTRREERGGRRCPEHHDQPGCIDRHCTGGGCPDIRTIRLLLYRHPEQSRRAVDRGHQGADRAE
jgi:hypothetical protein